MPHPQSLLAELRALEARRAQGGLSPAEELRFAELRAVSGAAPAPSGFDVNAAATAIRDSLGPGRAPLPNAALPLPLPQPDGGALGPRTPPLEAEPVAPVAIPPAPEEAFAPLPGIEAGAPQGYDLAAPGPAAPEDMPVTQNYDVVPAFDASSPAGQWDPNAAPAAWDPNAATAGQEGAASPVTWEPSVAPGATWEGESPGPGAAPLDPGAIGQSDPNAWWNSAPAAPEGGEAQGSPPAAPQKPDHDTASWDLSGGAGPAMAVPDEAEPGATAKWSVGQEEGGATAFRLPEGWAEEAEPAFLDELQLESEGSFAVSRLEAQAAVEPVEVSDDQILEVGADVLEVADDIPTLEAVELADEARQPSSTEGAATGPEPEPGIAAAGPDIAAPEPALPEVYIPPLDFDASAIAATAGHEAPELPPPPAAAPGGGQPGPEGEPVALDSLTIDEAPLEAAPPGPKPPPRRIVTGLHRVVVHTVEGQVKRGSLADPDLESRELLLSPQPSGAAEALPADRVRAIFFMLGAGEKPPPPEGMKVRVTFKDGRQVAGFSPDYDPDASGFFMIPADTRTNTARIWVYRSAVRQVAVS